MKYFLITLTLFSLAPALFGQGLGSDSHRLTDEPWNGDWLQERRDQMVHGEEFMGYPGPIPKLYSALGLDNEHPASDFELQVLVNRDAPNWHGTCNGWAAAATLFPEPGPVVINGVKLLGADMKAILASVWKDNVEDSRGSYDTQGITARSFEEVLYATIAKNKHIIFDVTLGLESWNYPVAAFDRSAVQNGDYVDVTMDVHFTNTAKLIDLDSEIPEHRKYLTETYTYRYIPGDENSYEWTGASVTDRPQQAWLARAPFFSGGWMTRANHQLTNSLYLHILELADDPLNEIDLYEPNGSLAEARAIPQNLVLASAIENEDDFYKLEKGAGEPFDIEFRVYDGSPLDLIILDANGDELDRHIAIEQAQISLPEDYEGAFFFHISGETGTSFYRLVRPQTRGWFQAEAGSRADGAQLTAMNIRETEGTLVTDEVTQLPAAAGKVVQAVTPGQLYRTDARTVWAVEQYDQQGYYKKYHRGHQLKMPYVVPHLTCRNGWKTLLDIQASRSDEVLIHVYDGTGELVTVQPVPTGSEVDLVSVLGNQAAGEGTWFELTTHEDNRLEGRVTYHHQEWNYRAYYDIQSRPRHGELSVTQLPTSTAEGWVGLALVNTADERNPIYWRLRDDQNRIVEEGSFELQAGEKWLGLPQSLFQSEIENQKYILTFFATYNLETLALRHDPVNGADYAHRLYDMIVDQTEETYVSMPRDRASLSYVFSNPNSRANWVRFRGYDAAGSEVFQYWVQDKSMRPYETRYMSFDELMAGAGADPEELGVTYFKVTSTHPLIFFELLSDAGSPTKTLVPVVNVFDNP